MHLNAIDWIVTAVVLFVVAAYHWHERRRRLVIVTAPRVTPPALPVIRLAPEATDRPLALPVIDTDPRLLPPKGSVPTDVSDEAS